MTAAKDDANRNEPTEVSGGGGAGGGVVWGGGGGGVLFCGVWPPVPFPAVYRLVSSFAPPFVVIPDTSEVAEGDWCSSREVGPGSKASGRLAVATRLSPCRPEFFSRTCSPPQHSLLFARNRTTGLVDP